LQKNSSISGGSSERIPVNIPISLGGAGVHCRSDRAQFSGGLIVAASTQRALFSKTGLRAAIAEQWAPCGEI
jgi:hypothetical protein